MCKYRFANLPLQLLLSASFSVTLLKCFQESSLRWRLSVRYDSAIISSFFLCLEWYLLTISSHVITYGTILALHLCVKRNSLASSSYFLSFSDSAYCKLSSRSRHKGIYFLIYLKHCNFCTYCTFLYTFILKLFKVNSLTWHRLQIMCFWYNKI